MSYKLFWYEDNRVLVGSFQGTITPQDIIQVNEDAVSMVRQGLPPVYDIIDALELERIPFDFKWLRNSMQLFNEPNLGWVILITRNPLFSFFGSTLSQMAGKPFRVVESWDEALKTLSKIDPTLSALAAER